ncbi:MAG: MarR family winged helix-turn-helix transcriptional regulator, partial [Gammaproteobacteria bacterium]
IIPYCLSVVSNEISNKIALSSQTQFGLDLHQWRVMAVLGEESNISAQDVSARTAMDKVAVSRAVKKLIHSNMVSREFDVNDKRRSILSLTSDGQTIYQQIVPLAKTYESNLLQQLSDDEIAELVKLLNKLRKANENLNL